MVRGPAYGALQINNLETSTHAKPVLFDAKADREDLIMLI